MTRLTFTIPGRPSTRHRGKRFGKGQRTSYRDPVYDAWKAYVGSRAREARPRDWPMHAVGPRGGKRRMLYAVSIVGYASDGGYDADNLRGIPDACEGILWPNDRRVCPVAYDCRTSAEDDFVRVEVTAWDPSKGQMHARFEWEGDDD